MSLMDMVTITYIKYKVRRLEMQYNRIVNIQMNVWKVKQRRFESLQVFLLVRILLSLCGRTD